MKRGMGRLMIAFAAAAAGTAIAAAAHRYTPAQEGAGREPVELNLLMSLGGDSLREDYMRRRLAAFSGENPDMRVSATFVESDTLVFLKLLYAGKGYHYDVVCMGDDSMLSAAEQRLIHPLDELLMKELGLPWLDAVPGVYLENTVNGGKIYGLPFVKSRLRVYYRSGAGAPEHMRGGQVNGGQEQSGGEQSSQAQGGQMQSGGGQSGQAQGGQMQSGGGQSGQMQNSQAQNGQLQNAGGRGDEAQRGEVRSREAVSLEELLRLSGQGRIGLPAGVLIRDLLLSTDSSGWDGLRGETERYQVNLPERAALLTVMKEGLERGSLVDGDCERLMEDFVQGRLDAVVLEDLYGEELERRTGEKLASTALWRTSQTPWLCQGCNLYLADWGEPHDYGPAWELVEYLVRDGAFDARTGGERDMEYKRVLSRKNTKAYLIVDRMIAEFLHGHVDCGELLERLQSQLDTALGE
ncbi:MAG: hypothetical protein KH230_26730 [Enterocloster asparagiformis]|nr:hypothetical protein [Enterocloster asparagiformis]